MAQKFPTKNNDLRAWTWPYLLSTYKKYAGKLQEILDLAKRLDFQLPLDSEVTRLQKMHPDRAEIVSRAFLHTTRINTHLRVLEREIERRSTLIGVWG